MKSNFIEINGKKIELIYTTWASKKLGEVSEKANPLEWFNIPEEENKADAGRELFRRTCIALEILANAAVIKNNTYISLGMSNGERREMYPEGIFENILTVVETAEMVKVMMNTIMKGSAFEVPPEFALEVDEDYLEIEAEKKRT